VKRYVLYSVAAVAGLSSLVAPLPFRATVHASDDYKEKYGAPLVFQAAGPTVEAIQGFVDAYRNALGSTNNGNAPGPLADGRREINWDGGGSTATSVVPTPFDGFLLNRGARFTTRGSGFVQAPVDGLATTFENATYEHIFQAFSPVRLFSPIESNVTNTRFFVPGGGELPATTTGFGAIFTDVDQPDGSGDPYDRHDRDKGEKGSTSIAYYGVHGNLLFSSEVPASPGDAGVSFFGIVFHDARIAHVRIKSGDVAPGKNANDRRRDVVVMDDFIYGEPQPIPY
jgi:hypothetical protein